MDTPERKSKYRSTDDEVVRGSNGHMPVNPYFMPMYYPQYMPPVGMPMGYPMNANRISQDYEADRKNGHDISAGYQPMPFYQPMPYMPNQPMGMPGFYQQPAPQFTYSRSYFYPDEE